MGGFSNSKKKLLKFENLISEKRERNIQIYVKPEEMSQIHLTKIGVTRRFIAQCPEKRILTVYLT